MNQLVFKVLLSFFCFHSISLSYSSNVHFQDHSKIVKMSASEIMEKGGYFEESEDLDTALLYYLALIGRYSPDMDLFDKQLCMNAYNCSGQIYYNKGNYSKAFELFLQAIQISEEYNIQSILPELYKNAGNVYCSFQDYEPGINLYIKGLLLAQQQGNEEIEIKLLNNLSGMYCYIGETKKARKYYERMLEYVDASEVQPYLLFLNKGLIHIYETEYDSAASCFKQSVDYANQHNLGATYLNSSYTELSHLYEKKHQTDSALHYTQKAINIVKESGPMYLYAENLKNIARLYQNKGDTSEALKYRTHYLTLCDSIFSQDEFHKMKNTQFIYEMNKSYHTIKSLNADKEKREIQVKAQRRILIIVIISLSIFIILLAVVYTQKRNLHRTYVNLFNKNKDLIESNKQYKELKASLSKNSIVDQKKEDVFIDKLNLQSSDKLSDEQTEKLLEDINRVMEDPDKFCDCEFGLSQLASLVDSNSRYVSKVINKTYNKNFRAFLNEYRIREAQLRLMNTEKYGNYTIKAIAESVGYKSHANFILIFKDITGMLPSLYQSMTKKGF